MEVSTPGSEARMISAVAIGPHILPVPNTAHSAMGFREVSFTTGKGRVTIEEKTLKPVLPVSKSTSLIVWQVVVPGMQIVTLTQGSF